MSECRAKRWKGTPVYDGPHDAHFFTYGPHGMYTGSCIGRSEREPVGEYTGFAAEQFLERTTAEIYDETRYTPEAREIIEQEAARRDQRHREDPAPPVPISVNDAARRVIALWHM